FDEERVSHQLSLHTIRNLMNDGAILHVNSDTLTTAFYLLRSVKKATFEESLYALRETTKICELVSIELEDVHKALSLCENNSTKCKDYEDTLQYVCAKKVNANLIVTNDKGFVGLDIAVKRTKE
ncbi:MAG TPA: PIN domain-containing protein, partial [Epsilonproteobacteria bacterium]|nr:PIN domain-containing protein [Campylobacterota bacterium]